jgi:hypothetical protein
MAYRRSANIEYLGGTVDLPDYIYYNADIINAGSSDTGVATPDPQIRFNETRDSALVRDASQYNFSIIRFTMDGANLDLPLFIPQVQLGEAEGEDFTNLTVYGVALPFQQSFHTAEGDVTITVTPDENFVIYESETLNTRLAPVPRRPTTIAGQDVSSRYYWVYTYQHWIDLVNTALNTASQNTWTQFGVLWTALGSATPNPYLTYDSWLSAMTPPQIVYDPTTYLMTIYGDTRCFGDYIPASGSGPYVPVAPALSAPQCRLFFNTNMFGMFANFSNNYYNTLTPIGGWNNGVTYVVPSGYVNEILFANKDWTNVKDDSAVPYVPTPYNVRYWINTQDYRSIDSLWSPIASIVFTSALLPIKSEATGQPIKFGPLLGDSNLGNSAPTSQSAFQPIITDIALPMSTGAHDYRAFIYYAPTAQYRLADLSPSKQEIRSIDIQVFWKYRLTGELFPINMFNLSSVSIKALFRNKNLSPKA